MFPEARVRFIHLCIYFYCSIFFYTFPIFSHSILKMYGIEQGPNSRNFYQKTINESGNTSVIFMSPSIVEYCQNRRIIVGMDATFKVVPRIGDAYQLFGIHLLLDGTVRFIYLLELHFTLLTIISLYLQAYPIMQALMERKTIRSYLAVLKEFVNVCTERKIVVEKVVSDFEAALRSAIETLMPETTIVGCYFHFARAVYMKFKKMGLVRNPTEQKTIASKMAMCLSLLPANQINSGIAIIRGNLLVYFI